MNELIITAKLLIAGMIGFLIGRERKKNDKPGGSRTFALVCLGSALIALLSLELLNMPRPEGVIINFTRLISYTIVSMGFLGSGIIMHNKGEIGGLTTAGSLFALVPIGISIGLGYYFLGIMTSIITYIILELKHWIGEEND